MARILIAEDDGAVRLIVRRGLHARGHETVAVADGAAALEALAVGRFDLLLTDIVMPVMDGIALALKVARDYPQVRILMMTGYAEERKRAHNLDVLIHDVIAKPFTLDQLAEAVDQALQAAT